METKCCSVCKEQKPKSEFVADKKSKDKLGYRCFLCRKEYRGARKEKIVSYNKQYRIDNRERRRLYNIDYISKNEEKMNLAKEKYKLENKEKLKESRKKSSIKNKERINSYRIKYEQDPVNKERKNKLRRERISKNREFHNEYQRQWRIKNRERLSERHRQRIKNEPIYALKIKIRDAIKNALSRKGYSKTGSTQKILGCDYDFFIQYIESQFKKGMTWENATIDHIKPLKSAKTEEDVLLLNHYTNLQPMFGPENSSKKDKLITKQLRLL